MPYVTKFLQDSSPSEELARRSQENLQRTVNMGDASSCRYLVK